MDETYITPPDFRSGFCVLIGRPNAGKSSLVNAILGKKLAITSDCPQTTRKRFRAIRTTDTSQLIFVDTPGVHKPQDTLSDELNTTALKSLEDADMVAFCIDITKPIGKGDEWVFKKIAPLKCAKTVLLLKTDLCSNKEAQKQIDALKSLGFSGKHFLISNKTHTGIQEFLDFSEEQMPEGPLWFPRDVNSDEPIEELIAEFIREKILRSFSDEVPHAVGVALESLEYKKQGSLAYISAFIFVEHQSQKGILIGAHGKAIKEVGTLARIDLEKALGIKVFLDLRVKVKKNWRRDYASIKRFGYGE